jgi:two-component system, cell cycle response regulator DivK
VHRSRLVDATDAIPPRVLVVDDVSDMRDLYMEFLELAGFQVVEAANGVEALRVAQSEQPSAIVMDLEMPTMKGAEATRLLRQDERTKAIPVIVLTGTSSKAELSNARAAGCTAVLRKPCMPDVLLEALRLVLRGEAVPRDLALP